MRFPRCEREQIGSPGYIEHPVEVRSLESTTSAIDHSQRGRAIEGYLVGAHADDGTIFAMEFVDGARAIAFIVLVCEPPPCQCVLQRSWDSRERAEEQLAAVVPEKESSDYGYGASNNQGHFDMIQDKCRTMKDSSSFRPDMERIL